MKIQYCSDLHLEFDENTRFMKEYPLEPKADILIMAGDILPFRKLYEIKAKSLYRICPFLDLVSKSFKEVYWIPGNHEWYGSNIQSKPESFHEMIRPNVHLLNNTQVDIDGVSLLFTTLWSHIKPENEWDVEFGMNDFRVIKNGKYKLSSENFNAMHKSSLEFLESTTKSCLSEKKVVITHHVPTKRNFPVGYKNSYINDAYVTELHPLIIDLNADYWIYGHHHKNIPEFEVGNTKMVTNQLGYVNSNQHGSFRTDAVITV
jgi:DNA repair exonuclease SbcCD nuclease subunit